ncbi:MAG: hypothetical protein Q9162_003626 [Coniocarpon cinnabarinum]
MPDLRKDGYSLLRNETCSGKNETLSGCEDFSTQGEPRYGPGNRLRAVAALKSVLLPLLILSSVANIIQALLLTSSWHNFIHHTQPNPGAISSDVSAYAELRLDPNVHFPYSTGYGPEVTNHSLLDERWEAIDINAGVVAMSDDWAFEHNLAPTQRFPWDPSKGVYLLTAFHTLHCLKNIHRILYDAHHGRPLSRDPGHALHCVDHLRKDAMCTADDYLLPSPKERYSLQGPHGQPRVCKDWDALVNWAERNTACYQHISDDEDAFANEHAEIERYGNCPVSSPYYEKVQNYFQTRDQVVRH